MTQGLVAYIVFTLHVSDLNFFIYFIQCNVLYLRVEEVINADLLQSANTARMDVITFLLYGSDVMYLHVFPCESDPKCALGMFAFTV